MTPAAGRVRSIAGGFRRAVARELYFISSQLAGEVMKLPQAPTQKVVAVGIAILVAALHFATRSVDRGPFAPFVRGYLLDILVPFAMVLALGVTIHPRLHSRIVRSALVFAIGAISETLQYFGVPLFGRTFDPLDYLMFAAGIAGALAFESAVISRCRQGTQEAV